MFSKPAFLILLWVVGLAAAFLLGRMARPDAGSPDSAPAARGRGAEVISPPMSPGKALHLANPQAAAGAFAQAVTELGTSGELRSSFEELLPGFEDARTHDALIVVADAWGAAAPEDACAWLDKLEFNDVRNPYLFSALTQWAGADPEAALAWLDSHHSEPGPSRDYLLAALVRGMAGRDPDAALQVLLGSSNSPERTGSIDFLVRAWSRAGLDHALGMVAALPAAEARLKQRAIRQVVDNLDAEELESAKTWAAALASLAERRLAQSAIAANWSRHDPVAAAAWAGSLEDTATRAAAYGEIATRWARADPLAAGKWLDQHAGQAGHDLAARAVAWSTVGIDPATAFSQVARITHPPLRDESFEQLGRIWLSEQPQRAKLFFEGESPIPAAIRERLLKSFE